jgi:hypothetical protein
MEFLVLLATAALCAATYCLYRLCAGLGRAP